MIESLVYDTTYVGRYRDAIKSRLEVADILAYERIKACMASIEAHIRTEQTPEDRPPTTPGTGTPNGPLETLEQVTPGSETGDGIPSQLPAEVRLGFCAC